MWNEQLDIGDRWSSEWRKRWRTGLAGWKNTSEQSNTLGHKTILISPFQSRWNSQKNPTRFVFSGYLWHLYPTMAFIDMNNVQFYQSSKTAGLLRNGQPATTSLSLFTARLKGNDPKAFGSGKISSGSLQSYDLVEILDMTDLLPKESFHPFYLPASNLEVIRKNIKGTVLRPCISKTMTYNFRYLGRTQ